MEFDPKEKDAVRELGEAVNIAIEQSPFVADAIEYLREMGYEPDLNLRLEIALQELDEKSDDENLENPDLDLTDEDLRILQRMKILV